MLFLVKHRAVNLQIVFCTAPSGTSVNPEYNWHGTDTGLFCSVPSKVQWSDSECEQADLSLVLIICSVMGCERARIVQWVQCLFRAECSRFQILVGARDFSFLQNIHTEAHPASYLMGSRALSQGVKQPRCELIHSPPSSAKVKNEWNYTFTPSICLHAIYRENLNLSLVV